MKEALKLLSGISRKKISEIMKKTVIFNKKFINKIK
jgi:hypothetical protein